MSDKELIARLRENQAYEWQDPIWETRIVAADRIEALTAKLATCEKYRDAYDEMGRIGTQAVRDLEAKLAKAVEGLHAVVQHEASTFFGPDGEKNKRASWRGVMRKARAALAEIKGESYE